MEGWREGRQGVPNRVKARDGRIIHHNVLFGTWGWADEAVAVNRARPKEDVCSQLSAAGFILMAVRSHFKVFPCI